MSALMYGGGLRLMEVCELRVKDLDLAAREIRVRDGKGRKDRVTVLPTRMADVLVEQLARVRAVHERDLAQGTGWVALPDALSRKHPNAGRARLAVGVPGNADVRPSRDESAPAAPSA